MDANSLPYCPFAGRECVPSCRLWSSSRNDCLLALTIERVLHICETPAPEPAAADPAAVACSQPQPTRRKRSGSRRKHAAEAVGTNE